ncbi:MAG: SAM-dependent methyltransferase [Fidelibacterota bacterium]
MDQADSDGLQLTRLYSRLSRWTRLKSRLTPGNRSTSLLMHKTVSPSVDDLTFEAANLPSDPRVLDAGCGLGGTVFRWHEKGGGTYDGITLSPAEVEAANREARRRGLSSYVRFSCRSYDEPLGEGYDAVVAIESLIHSKDLPHSVDLLSRVLKPGGRLVMVDDVLRDDGDPVARPSLIRLKGFWYLTDVPSEGNVRMAFRSSGLNLVEETDLTGDIRWSSSRFLSLAEGLLKVVQFSVPVGWIREVVRAYRGGMALRRLYDEGRARYKLFVGEKGKNH